MILTEHQECVTIAQYLELLKNKGDVLVYTKTTQETFTRSWSQKRKNKSEGLRSGLPDFIIVFTNGIVLFLEIKRTEGGRLSPAQNEWLSALMQTDCMVHVAYGADQAIKIIDNILKI